MPTVEQTGRERELEGLCESQRPEIQEIREGLRPRTTAGCDTKVGRGGPPRDVAPASGRAEPNALATGTGISEYGEQHLAAIDDLVRELQLATSTYRDRLLDWDDVACLMYVRAQLSGGAKGFAAAEAAAATRRAARHVATEVRLFREMEQRNR